MIHRCGTGGHQRAQSFHRCAVRLLTSCAIDVAMQLRVARRCCVCLSILRVAAQEPIEWISMPDYIRLPIGEKAPRLVNAVIEIPRDSVNKYEYDKQLHVFSLDRTLFSPVHYPGDYGFIPCTLGLDGDPLDVLVLVEAP